MLSALKLNKVSTYISALIFIVFILLLFAILKGGNYWLLGAYLLMCFYLFLTGSQALNKLH